jgi:hypothetical protein
MRRPGFNVKVDTKRVVDALSNKLPAAYARESGPALEEIADGIIASIRRRRIWPNEKRGILKKGLWRDEPQFRRSGAEIDMGWSGPGAAFGPPHEWGFKKSKWKIAPVNLRTSTKHSSERIGKPIKALRFVMGGRVLYSRGHEVSKPREEKPHFAPAAEAYPVEARMGRALDTAVRRAGL